MTTRVVRTAVITGAARGIGAGIAHRLAAEGYVVAVLDLMEESCRPVVAEIDRAGGRALAVSVDVSDEASVARAIEHVHQRSAPPTVLVNNAGIIRDNLLFKMTATDWDDVVSVHLRGAFLMSREVQRHMTEAGWGRIVNISSTSALGNAGQANYAAAKAGVQGFTKTLALELGRFGITVNAVAPGFIATDMTAATAERLGMPFDDFKRAASDQIPVRRVGTAEDVAHAVAFLTSEGAGFVSGQVIYVAGGPQV